MHFTLLSSTLANNKTRKFFPLNVYKQGIKEPVLELHLFWKITFLLETLPAKYFCRVIQPHQFGVSKNFILIILSKKKTSVHQNKQNLSKLHTIFPKRLSKSQLCNASTFKSNSAFPETLLTSPKEFDNKILYAIHQPLNLLSKLLI